MTNKLINTARNAFKSGKKWLLTSMASTAMVLGGSEEAKADNNLGGFWFKTGVVNTYNFQHYTFNDAKGTEFRFVDPMLGGYLGFDWFLDSNKEEKRGFLFGLNFGAQGNGNLMANGHYSNGNSMFSRRDIAGELGLIFGGEYENIMFKAIPNVYGVFKSIEVDDVLTRRIGVENQHANTTPYLGFGLKLGLDILLSRGNTCQSGVQTVRQTTQQDTQVAESGFNRPERYHAEGGTRQEETTTTTTQTHTPSENCGGGETALTIEGGYRYTLPSALTDELASINNNGAHSLYFGLGLSFNMNR